MRSDELWGSGVHVQYDGRVPRGSFLYWNGRALMLTYWHGPLCRTCGMQTEWVPEKQAYQCVSPVCGDLVTAEWLLRRAQRGSNPWQRGKWHVRQVRRWLADRVEDLSRLVRGRA